MCSEFSKIAGKIKKRYNHPVKIYFFLKKTFIVISNFFKGRKWGGGGKKMFHFLLHVLKNNLRGRVTEEKREKEREICFC